MMRKEEEPRSTRARDNERGIADICILTVVREVWLPWCVHLFGLIRDSEAA